MQGAIRTNSERTGGDAVVFYGHQRAAGGRLMSSLSKAGVS